MRAGTIQTVPAQTDETTERVALIERLARGAAHELGNPLTAIGAFGRLLQSDPRLPDDLRHDADQLVAETERARRIAATFLDFARGRSEPPPTALRPAVERALELVAFELAAAGLRTTTDLPASLPAIALDRAALDQTLVAMLVEAIDAGHASRDGAVLAITASADDDGTVRLVVADRVTDLPAA